jgi:hypothetical protein
MKEIWKDIAGYEGLYQVSNYGRFKSLGNNFARKEKSKKAHIRHNGYMRITLNKKGKRKSFATHRLVILAFKENPENKRTVNHIDGNKTNNYIDNLEWATHTENALHSFRVLGRINLGPKSKIVINLESGIYYRSIKEAAFTINMNDRLLGRRLSGNVRNNTYFKLA